MAKAGFAVPGGFIATANAYRTFVDDNDLRTTILDLARPEVRQGRASFASAASSIEALFADAEVSDEIAAEIAEAYESLDGENPALAVRSSANAEDLARPVFRRPAGDLSERDGCASRGCGGQELLGVAMDRTCHRVPASERHRPGVGGDGGGGAGHGPLGSLGHSFHRESGHRRTMGDDRQREFRAR